MIAETILILVVTAFVAGGIRAGLKACDIDVEDCMRAKGE